MSIVIGADIVPVDSNYELFKNADIKELIGDDLQVVLNDSDFRIFNLETPLTNIKTPIAKHGPNLIAPTSSVKGLKAMGIDALALANNHIMDQDSQGLISTLKTLDDEKIAHFGADLNLKRAQKPLYFTIKEKKYGVYACAEHEFSIADGDSPGANPFDPLETPDQVASIKTQCDYLIVLYHGGKEHYRYPSPCLQKTCRKIVEKGADLVICQHSHCIGCKEEYRNGTIIYGQGNFLFDHADNEYWNTGLLILIDDSGIIEYKPIEKRKNCVRLAKGEAADLILGDFEKRSELIMDEKFIEENYKLYAKENIDSYLMYFTGKRSSFLFKAINRLSGYRIQKIVAKQYKRKMGKALRNYLECESHRELVITELKNV